MNIQLSLFDTDDNVCRKKRDTIGTYKRRPGAVIPHIMRSAYIGKKILIEESTPRGEVYRVGVLEEYTYDIERRVHRCIVFTGEGQRHQIDMYPGEEIFETEQINRMELARQNLMRRLWK